MMWLKEQNTFLPTARLKENQKRVGRPVIEHTPSSQHPGTNGMILSEQPLGRGHNKGRVGVRMAWGRGSSQEAAMPRGQRMAQQPRECWRVLHSSSWIEPLEENTSYHQIFPILPQRQKRGNTHTHHLGNTPLPQQVIHVKSDKKDDFSY